MRIALLALALLPVAAHAEESDSERSKPKPMGRFAPECRNADQHWAKAQQQQQPAAPRTLAREPAGEQYLTVLRLEGGCDKPVKVRARR
jgi:hypothetical protein